MQPSRITRIRSRRDSESRNAPHSIIVGGGIQGLAAASRLREAGHNVTVTDAAPRLSDGATRRNLGGIQAGSVYMSAYPDAVPHFLYGLELFQATFPRTAINRQPKLHVGTPDDVEHLQKNMKRFGIPFAPVNNDVLAPYYRGDISNYGVVEIDEVVASSHSVVVSLVQRCLKQGVHFLTNFPVTKVLTSAGKAYGVASTLDSNQNGAKQQVIEGDNMILAAGIGLPSILRSLGSPLATHFAIRGEQLVMTQGELDRAIHPISRGFAGVIPAKNGHVFLLTDATPHEIDSHAHPVDPAFTDRSVQHCRSTFSPKIVRTNGKVYSWTGGDIRYEPSGAADIHSPPLPAVLGPEQTGVSGLFIAEPGRMTFAIEASAMICRLVTGQTCEPGLPAFYEPISMEAYSLTSPPLWAHQAPQSCRNELAATLAG